MQIPEHLQLATAEFHRKLSEAKRSLGPQPFPWYPYDTFGYAKPLDALLLPNAIDVLQKLAGDLPVLDVGCGDGALSFFVESLGRDVDAVDHPPTNHNGMRGVRCMKQALGSKVEIHSMDIDKGFAPPRPLYGLTLFLGILYHLKNPFGILEQLAEHTQFCLLSTRIAQRTPRGAKMADEAVAYLVGEYELNQDESNYWIFSETALRRLLERTGWQVRGLVTTGDLANSEPVREDRDQRATCLIESLRAPRRDASRLVSGWFEEEDEWRWTAPECSVQMTPHPLDSAQGVSFRFFVNPQVAAVRPEVTVRAKSGGRVLGEQTFRGPGEHVFECPQRHAAGAGGAALQEASLDFSFTPSYIPPPPDSRQLGVQVIFAKTGPTLRREWTHPIRFIS